MNLNNCSSVWGLSLFPLPCLQFARIVAQVVQELPVICFFYTIEHILHTHRLPLCLPQLFTGTPRYIVYEQPGSLVKCFQTAL